MWSTQDKFHEEGWQLNLQYKLFQKKGETDASQLRDMEILQLIKDTIGNVLI